MRAGRWWPVLLGGTAVCVALLFLLWASRPASMDALVGAREDVVRNQAGADSEDFVASPVSLDDLRGARRRGSLRGILTVDGVPVPHTIVRATAERGPVPEPLVAPDVPDAWVTTRTDADGAYVFEGVPVGAYRLSAPEVEARLTKRGLRNAVDAARADGVEPTTVWGSSAPEPCWASLPIRVVDRQGSPVPRARVEYVGDEDSSRRVVVADEQGWARISRIPCKPPRTSGTVEATTDDAFGSREVRVSGRTLPSWSAPLEVVVARDAGRIVGWLRRREDRPVDGIKVGVVALPRASGQLSPTERLPITTRSDEEGRFVFERLARATYTVAVEAPPPLRMVFAENIGLETGQWKLPELQVRPGHTSRKEIRLIPGGTVDGEVRTETGEAVAGAKITLTHTAGSPPMRGGSLVMGVRAWDLPEPRVFPWFRSVVQSDAEGRYTVEGLLPGTYDVFVHAAGGLAFQRHLELEVRDGKTARPVHVLEPGGTLELVIRRRRRYAIRRVGRPDAIAAFDAPEGAVGVVTIPGLPVGRFEVVEAPAESWSHAVVLGAVEIEQATVTYADLSRAGNRELELRLTQGGHPVAGAQIRGPLDMPSARTDADGVARWRVVSKHPASGRKYGISGGPGSDGVELSVRVADDAGRVTLALPTGSLQLLVVDADGGPVPGAAAMCELQPDDGRAFPGRVRSHRMTSEAGTATWTGLPRGRCRITVCVPGTAHHETIEVRVTNGPERAEVRLPRTGGVHVRVLDFHGRPSPGADVRVFMPDEDVPDLVPQYTDAEGRALFQGLRMGRVRVDAIQDGTDGIEELGRGTVEAFVSAGEVRDLDLVLQPAR